MVSRIFIIVFLVVVLQAPILGQKVGTVGTKFLEISPSVRANGMGETGVALIDNNSMFFNPASLGLLHQEYRAQFTFCPLKTELPLESSLDFYSISARLIGGKFYEDWHFTIGVGYYFTRLKSDSIPLTTYGDPAGTVEYFYAVDKSHNFPIGVALSGVLDVGLGLNVKYIEEKYDDDKSEGIAYDAGFMVRIPSDKIVFPSKQNDDIRPFFSPSIGFSLCNFGPDFEMASHDYPLPQFRRLGCAAAFGFDRKVGDAYLTLIRITPTFEVRDYPVFDPEIRYGVELYLLDAVAGRMGRIDDDDVDYNTYGAGLQSRGVVRLFTDILFPRPSDSHKGLIKFIRDDLNIEFSYARKKGQNTPFIWYSTPVDYYSISISL